MDLAEHHAFITNILDSCFRKVCSKVKALTLSDAYSPFYDEATLADTRGPVKPRITINCFTFPAFQSLSISHKGKSLEGMIAVIPLPKPLELPPLSQLTILYCDLSVLTLLNFIKNYGCNLQSLTVKDSD